MTIRVCIVALVLSCTACLREPEKPIRLGFNPWPGYEFLALARELGYFEEEGAPVQLIELASLSDVRRAYERGQIDAFGGTLVELLLIHEQSNHRADVFLAVDFSNGSDMLLANTSIGSISGLRGKRVAMEPASLDVLVVAHALKSADMTLNDIEIAPMFQNEMPLAFERDEVGAAQTYPPNSSVILASGKAHKLFDSSMAPGLIVDILAGNPEMLSKRTDDFSALIRAFFRAQEYARQHPQEAMRIMAERQGLSVVAFEEALEGLQLIPLEEQASFLAEGGKLQEGLDVAKKSLADVGLLKNMAGLDQLFANAGPAKNAVGQ